MKRTLFAIAVLVASTIGAVGKVSARPEFVAPTGASGCTNCHFNELGGEPWKPGVLDAYFTQGIAGLAAYIQSLSAPDTAPVLSQINSKWDVTVGEVPLVIPFSVYDKEQDTFALHGSAPTGYTLAPLRIDATSQLPTIDLKWKPTAAQTHKNYTLSIYAQENTAGRFLKSNTVTASIHVWPARGSTTKNVSQFVLQNAKWSANTLTLSGLVLFKSTITPTQRAAALNTLQMNVRSISGAIISAPVKLAPNPIGYWTKTVHLTGSQAPCFVKLTYEGLNAARIVQSAPTSCIK
ncbi:MAG: hypothetical protein Q8N96_03995 [Methylovulum sp.]|nr:hypothetical protein [Methylovulum sp.]